MKNEKFVFDIKTKCGDVTNEILCNAAIDAKPTFKCKQPYIVLNSPYFGCIQINFKDTGKKHPKVKLQCFRKVWIWTFGWLVHQVNSIYEVPNLKQNFRKRKVVTNKTLFFVIGQFCTPLSICLNIGFWQSSFVRKCNVMLS